MPYQVLNRKKVFYVEFFTVLKKTKFSLVEFYVDFEMDALPLLKMTNSRKGLTFFNYTKVNLGMPKHTDLNGQRESKNSLYLNLFSQ